MSMTPVVPDLKEKMGFWFKKDSIGAWLLIAAVSAVVLFGWGVISAFVVMALTNAFQTIWLVAGCLASIWILTNKTFHILLRAFSRWVASLLVSVFPLQILEDRLGQARKRNDLVKDLISKVSGKVRLLKDTIAKNHAEAQEKFQEAAYAKGQVPTLEDQNQQLRYKLQVQVRTRKGARLEKANVSYQDILDRMQKIYSFLVKASTYLDAFIDDASDELQQERIKHETITSAYTAFKAALKIIKGDATEEELYGQAKDYLANDYSQKSGEIEDGMRIAQSFIDSMDIQNGVISDDAMAELDKYNEKLLTDGGQAVNTVPSNMTSNNKPVPVLVARGTSAPTDYDFFK